MKRHNITTDRKTVTKVKEQSIDAQKNDTCYKHSIILIIRRTLKKVKGTLVLGVLIYLLGT